MDNEELRESQNNFFTKLNVIQYYQDEIISLSDQLHELKCQYTETKHAFEKIIYWQEIHEETLSNLFRFTKNEQRKTQMLMDGWKKLFLYVKETISLSNKACVKMWNSTNELLEQFDMLVNEEFS